VIGDTDNLAKNTTNAFIRFGIYSGGNYIDCISTDGTTSKQFTIGGHPLIFAANNSEKMRLTSDGYLGIGTSSPSYSLEINGDLAFKNRASIRAKNSAGTFEVFCHTRWDDNVTYINYGSAGLNIRSSDDTSRIFVTNVGNVGIGTTSIYSKLQVHGGAANTEMSVTTDDGWKSRIGLYEAASKTYGAYLQYNGTNDNIEFGHVRSSADVSPEMVIQVDTGHAGIGKTKIIHTMAQSLNLPFYHIL